MIKTADLTPRQKKIIFSLLAMIAVYMLVGFLAAPFAVRSILENQVAKAINRQVAVGPVRVNPITLSVTLRDLNIRENSGGPFVKLDEAYANLQTSSLFKWALVLKSIRLVNPQIDLVRTGAATFNFSDIGQTPANDTTPAESSEDGSGLALAIYETAISGGQITVDDRVVAVNHRISNLDIRVTDFSSRPADVDVYTLFKLAARVNDADVTLDGKTRPFGPARETRADIGLRSLDVPHYLPYVPLPDNLTIQSLTVETASEIDFRMLDGGKPELIVAGVLSLIDSRLADGSGDPFVHHPRLTFDLLPSRVLTGELRLADVAVSAPEYFVKRLASGELYMPFLAPKAYEEAETIAAEDITGDFQPVITIDTLSLKHGVVHFTDLSNSDPFATTISDLNLKLDNFGLNSDRTALFRLTLKTEADESVELSGNAALEPLQASGTLEVSGIQASRYIPYIKDRFDFKAMAGTIGLGGNYRFRQEDDTPLISLAGGHLEIDKLNVVDEDDDEPLIALDRLRVADTTAELAAGEVIVGRLELDGASLSVRREKDGALNVTQAFVPAADGTAPKATGEKQAAATGSSPAASQPPTIMLKAVRLSDVTVDVEDRVPRDPVKLRLDQIAVSASNLSTASGAAGKADLKLRWEQGGQFQAGGDVTIVPLTLDMAVKAKKMDIRPFQPYISEQAGLIVTQGVFGTEGRLRLSQNASAEPVVSYTGKAGLNRFASIDHKNANDFLKWDALLFGNLEVGVNPNRVSIDQISLADFFARVIVDADGSVNLVTMFAPPTDGSAASDESSGSPVAATTPATPEPVSNADKTAIRIAQVTLSGGDVDFSDRFIKPNFNAKFHDLGGRVSGLESIAEKRADVLLEGMWSNHAPVKITGQINPLIDNPFVDLNLNISDIELSPFSPYSGKYLGYILEKGKLTFNVAYLMENRKLEGKNSIFIDQLTLGDTVDSPEAVSLPIKLAVALLKDREGNIELDLPVSGNLDDPQFKIGKVVLTVLKNLIVKIVSSPFAALGALAGGGEELSYLDFAAGVSEIDADNAAKMDKLAKILYERPGLKLDVKGIATPQGDREALQAALLETRLKAYKLERMMKKGKSAVPLEEIVISDEERPGLLEAVFEASGITAPLDDSGKPVELTPESMQMLLRTHTEVTTDDYRKLANQRAFSAKNYLLGTGQVERERVFILEPQSKSQTDEQKGSGKGQVVFSLK